MEKREKLLNLKKRGEAGFTLLEYTAGAAVLLVLVMAGLNTFGSGLNNMFQNLGTWATNQSAQVGTLPVVQNPDGSTNP